MSERARRHWLPDEDETLRRLHKTGASFASIGRQLGRSPSSCYARSLILGQELRGQIRDSYQAFERPVPTLPYVPRIEISGNYTMKAAHVD